MHPTPQRMQGSFCEIEHMLGNKTDLYKYRKIEMIPSILLHNKTKSKANKALVSAQTCGN